MKNRLLSALFLLSLLVSCISIDATLNPTPDHSPTQKWQQITTGDLHTCGIYKNELYCWGDGGFGQLGNSRTNDILTPTKVDVPFGVMSWLTIDAGNFHTCGIADNNQAYCWGSDTLGAIGNDKQRFNGQEVTPSQVVNPTNVSSWKSITAGTNHTCGIADNNQAYCWGGGLQGQIGNNTSKLDNYVPTPVTNPTTVSSWEYIVAANRHSCGIGDNKQVYCWGNGYSRVPIEIEEVPFEVTSWKLLSAVNETCAISDMNRAYCWDTYVGGHEAPDLIGSPSSSLKWHTINASKTYIYGLTKNGQIYYWRDNSNPESFGNPQGVTGWRAIDGHAHICGITDDSEAYCWGGGPYTRLGDGTIGHKATPTLVIKP